MTKLDINEIASASQLIRAQFRDHWLYHDPFRFCLEIFHRVLFKNVELKSPSLELGIGDGASSWFMHRGKGIDFGGDMPGGSTAESRGFEVEPRFDHFSSFIGLDMSDIPFVDGCFASIVTSETMFYGQDMPRTFAEVFRVLAPGGIGAFALPTDAWYDFPELRDWHRMIVPTAKFHSIASFESLIEQHGGTILYRRPFFSAAFEAVFQSHQMSDTGWYRAIRHVITDPTFAAAYERQLRVFERLIESELTRPEGPDDGFHHFVVFQKPGKLPDQLTPKSCCLACRGVDFIEQDAAIICTHCGKQYKLICGVPIMLRDSGTTYSPIGAPPLLDLFEAFVRDTLKAAIAADADFLRRVRVYDSLNPRFGALDSFILSAGLKSVGIRPRAIIRKDCAKPGMLSRGIPVLPVAMDHSADGDVVLAVAYRDLIEPLRLDLASQGLKGRLQILHWEVVGNQLKGGLTPIIDIL